MFGSTFRRTIVDYGAVEMIMTCLVADE